MPSPKMKRFWRTRFSCRLSLALYLIVAATATLRPATMQAQVRDQVAPTVIRIAPEAEFGRIISGAMGADGRVCLLDDIDLKVWCFDRQGRTLWSFGRKGEGPSEWRSVYRLAIGSDLSVVVADLATATIHRISSTGKYLGRLRLPLSVSQLSSILLAGVDTLVVSATVYQGGKAVESGIHVLALGDTIARVRSFGVLPESKDEQKLLMFGAGSVTLTPKGTLLYSQRFPNIVLEYSMQGDMLRQVASPYPTRGPDAEFKIDYQGDRRRISSVVLTPGVSVVGPARHGAGEEWWLVRTTSEGRQFVDRFDPASKKWGEPMPLPEWPSRISVLGRDDKTGFYTGYSTCEDEPCLVRFRLPTSRTR